MKKLLSILIATILLVGLMTMLAPVAAIITGYTVEVAPAKISPGGIFHIWIDANAFTGQMFDVWLASDGYAAGTGLVVKLAEGVKVSDVVNPAGFVNMTLMMPEDVEPGTGYYIKITDDGGSTWAVSNEIEVLDPAKYYIDFLNGTSVSYVDTITDYYVFNVTVNDVELAAAPTLEFVAIKEMIKYWIKDYEVVDFTNYFSLEKTEGGAGENFYAVWSKVKNFALPNPEGKMILLVSAEDTDGNKYVVPGPMVVKPSVHVTTSPKYVGDLFTIMLHNFPNETTDGEAINVTKVILTDAAGIEREVELTGLQLIGPDGSLTISDYVPPLQGGGKEDGVTVNVELNATGFLKVEVVPGKFTIWPKLVEVKAADADGEFTESLATYTAVPGDYVFLNGSGFLVTGETFKVKLYNVSEEEYLTLTVLDSSLSDNGYAAFVIQLPKSMAEGWNGNFKFNVTGTTDTNFADTDTYTMELPTDISKAKLFVNPSVSVEGIESGEVTVNGELKIEGIGFGKYDIANVTAIRPEGTTEIVKFTVCGCETEDVDVSEYAVDLGLHSVESGYFYVETVMPHAPKGEYTIWANYSDTAMRVKGISFNITPVLVLPLLGEVEPGDTISISGYGYPENTEIYFVWDYMFPVSVTTDDVGDLEATMTVPKLGPGLHLLAELTTGETLEVVVKDLLAEKVDELSAKVDELSTKLDTVAEEVSSKVAEELATVTSAQAELSDKVSSLEGKVSSLEGKVSTLEGKVSDLSSKLDTVSSKVEGVSGSLGNIMTATIGSAVIIIIIVAIAIVVLSRRRP